MGTVYINRAQFFLEVKGMSNLLNTMKTDNNFTYTENGSVTHESTLNHVLDMFALGGSYRTRTDKEIEKLFGDAYRENSMLALKCLFYLRDCRGGQGERRFFRVAYKWLIKNDIKTAKANLHLIPFYGRIDDLYICVDTPLEEEMFYFLKNILKEDIINAKKD
jgi:hypothetical protein